jgi:hypothetical protein
MTFSMQIIEVRNSILHLCHIAECEVVEEIPGVVKLFSLSPNLRKLGLFGSDNLEDIFNWLPYIVLHTTSHTLEVFAVRGHVTRWKQLTYIPETLDVQLSQPQFKYLETLEITIVGHPTLEEPTCTMIKERMPRLMMRGILSVRFLYDDN